MVLEETPSIEKEPRSFAASGRALSGYSAKYGWDSSCGTSEAVGGGGREGTSCRAMRRRRCRWSGGQPRSRPWDCGGAPSLARATPHGPRTLHRRRILPAGICCGRPYKGRTWQPRQPATPGQCGTPGAHSSRVKKANSVPAMERRRPFRTPEGNWCRIRDRQRSRGLSSRAAQTSGLDSAIPLHA